MGRLPRIHYPGAVYHVVSRGVDGMDVFVDDLDRELFLATLERVRLDAGARIIAFCLMGNHFHLVIQVADIPLSEIMQRLLTSYVTGFNRRHKRTGHLFQSRYTPKICADEAYLLTVINYVHQNPVRAGFVKNARDWRWSSVHQFADDGSGEDFTGFDPWEGSTSEKISLQRAEHKPLRSLDEFAERVMGRTSVSLEVFRSPCRLHWVVAARREFAIDAFRGGHTLQAIADWLGMSRTAVSKYVGTC